MPQLYSPIGEWYCFAVIFGMKSKWYSLREFYGEYNITETIGFNITFFFKISRLGRGIFKRKYHCETCLTISLIILIFEIGWLLKYVTHYDTFKSKVSIFLYKRNSEKLLYEGSPQQRIFISYIKTKKKYKNMIDFIVIKWYHDTKEK